MDGFFAIMLTIGSHALSHYTDVKRVMRDSDFIAYADDVYAFVRSLKRSNLLKTARPFNEGKKFFVEDNFGRIYEFEIAWPDSSAEELLKLCKVHGGETPVIPSLNVLYALKMSHRYLRNSPHFKKTHSDIMLMRSLGAAIDDSLTDWYKRREAETYNYAHPKLNVSKSDFFNGDGVEYVYDHDVIHEVMAHLGAPAYTFFKDDQAEVFCSKSKFEAQPLKTRLYAVLEETQVLALERSQIPFDYKHDPRKSFDMAHEKVCTSITSGWFREFAWEHYSHVQAMYEDDYVSRFRAAMERLCNEA